MLTLTRELAVLRFLADRTGQPDRALYYLSRIAAICGTDCANARKRLHARRFTPAGSVSVLNQAEYSSYSGGHIDGSAVSS
jgi:hypothetical protein